MSISDPLIKELKVHTGKFLEIFQNNGIIYDTDPSLISFCTCLENIFNNGIISVPNSFGFIRHNDPWTWIDKIATSKKENKSYPFMTSIEIVRGRKNIFTNIGKLRLAIRCFLTKKCLHVPVEIMLNTEKFNKYYDKNSILGDEILSKIFLSVLYQCSKINFHLNLKNTSFLDISWILPETIQLELVPSTNLGMSVSFAGEKAIIVDMKSNSVCAESGKISVGDVLDNLNGICICSTTSGRLGSLLKCQKGLPINLYITKAIYSKSHEFYPPILKLFKHINLDPDIVKSKAIDQEENLKKEDSVLKTKQVKKKGNGFKVIYIGCVDVGKFGDVKQIDKAFNLLFSPTPKYGSSKCSKLRVHVIFEVCELGVKTVDTSKNEEIFKHSYMEISSCGSVLMMPNYFAYIAGEDYCNVAKNFKCYIYMSDNDELAYRILQGIGSGFQRTHYAV